MADFPASATPKVANVPNGGVAAILAATGVVTMGSDTNGTTIYTAGAYGGRLHSMTSTTNDATVPPLVHVWILRGATVIPVGTVTIPVSSGNTLAAKLNVDFLDSANIVGLVIDNAGKRYLDLMPNDVVRCGVLVALTAAKTCWVRGSGADYIA